jgi:hypothetical protein
MSKDLLSTYWWVFFILGFAHIGVHYFVIYPYLKSRAIHPTLHWFSNFIWADTAAYKRARLSAGQSLTWWYVIHAIRVLGYLLLIGVLYLLWHG